MTIAALLLIVEAAAAAEEGGDINLFGGDLGVALWSLLIFGLVVFVLGKFAWGPLLGALQQRESFIRESLESAKKDRETAEAHLKEFEERLAKAREEASAIVDEGRRDAEETAKRILSDAKSAAKAEQDRAVREIEIARNTALKDLYDQSSQLAMTMATSVLKREMKPEDHEQLIRDTLAQVRDGSQSAN